MRSQIRVQATSLRLGNNGLQTAILRSEPFIASQKRLSATLIILCVITLLSMVSSPNFMAGIQALPTMWTPNASAQSDNRADGRAGDGEPTTSSGSAGKAASQAAAQASTAVCNDRSTATASAPFANCPTFALNFNTLPNGPLSDQYFNIYTGKPEANDEAQYYTNDQKNLRIENGKLLLTALNESKEGYKYTSARINTKGKQDFLYGKIVVRATLPKGSGTWPAIWMLATNEKYKSLDPYGNPNRNLADGELDIAEAVGTEPNTVYGIAHSLATPADGNRSSGYFNTVVVPNNDTTFHDYEIDWTPTSITYLVDGKPFFTKTKQAGADYRTWSYDQPYYLIINLALGGSWGGRDKAHFPGDGVDPSALPATMGIQSINYYPYVK